MTDVVIASGDNAHLVDALSAGPLATLRGAPILLTQENVLPAATTAEIKRLGATRAYVIGTVDVIGTAVETALRAAGITTIVRLGGVDRYATAAAVSKEMFHDGQGRNWFQVVTEAAFMRDIGITVGKGRRRSVSVSDSVSFLDTSTSNKDGGSTGTLERVPWEGGPAYYASFPQAVASGMTDPSFFPILVDFEDTSEGASVVAIDKAYGVNGYYRLTANSDLAAIRAAGMVAFPGSDIRATPGSETVGWNVDDETDMNYPQGWGSGQAFDMMYRQVNAVNTAYPGDGRIRHMNYGKSVAFNESDNICRVFVNGTDSSSPSRLPGATDGRAFNLDATSLDAYYYTMYLSDYDKNSLVEWGADRSLLRRAISYGRWGVDRIRRRQAMESPPNYQPTYGFVEIICQMQPGEASAEGIPTSTPSDDQIRGAVWACLLFEARGIIYFVHDFNYSGDYHNLRNNIGGHTPAVTALNAQITRLAPVLNTQSYVWTFNSTIVTMLKQQGGYWYIFAMSDVAATHNSGSRTFTLPAEMPQSGTVTVVDESRTIPLSGGHFSDSFAYEYTYHIYRIG